MDEITLRKIIAENLVYYRREKGMTQAALAETLNYSDKSVSKWERGEGLPDITVLYRLAEYYGITVNDLLMTPEARQQAEESAAQATQVAEAAELIEEFAEVSAKAPKKQRSLRTRILVPVLSIGLVWLVAMVVFFFMEVLWPSFAYGWLIFLYAVPASFIVATVFACIWWNHISRFICVSGIVWSVALSVSLSIVVPNIWLIHAVAGVLQILVILWFIQFKK